MVPRWSRRLLLLLLVAGIGLVGCNEVEGAPEPRSDGAADPSAVTDPSTVDDPAHAGVPPLHPSVDGYPEAVVTIHRQEGAAIRLPVKLADTPELRRHGLMEVPELPDGTGMLFAFDDDHRGGFWMKDTLVPLDIAFVDAGGGIVAVLAMDPCEADPCEVYEPGTEYRTALEVPQGWFASEGITVGDELTYERSGTP